MIKNLWTREPTAVIATAQTIIALAVAFGLSLSAVQVGAIVAVMTSIGGLVIRSQVVPVAALEELAAAAPPV